MDEQKIKEFHRKLVDLSDKHDILTREISEEMDKIFRDYFGENWGEYGSQLPTIKES